MKIPWPLFKQRYSACLAVHDLEWHKILTMVQALQISIAAAFIIG
jgi:hypothetical protein